jgi:tetratricopeptide (TPR) repeat protein
MQIWSAEIKEIEKLFEAIKERFPELEKELKQLVITDDPNVIMLYSRRCLEVIVTYLCESELKRPRKTEPLKGIIDKLSKEEIVPSNIITSMDHLNGLSTYGTHPKDFDPEQVKPVLNNLSTVLKWYLRYKESPIIDEIKTEEEKTNVKEPIGDSKNEIGFQEKEKPAEQTTKKLLSRVLYLIIILAVIAIFIYPKLLNVNKLDNPRSSNTKISVVVMPFQNMTNDSTWNVWQEGLQTNLATFLSNYSEDLNVRQTESINSMLQNKGHSDYASITPTIASTISNQMDAKTFITGSINQEGQTVRVNAQLFDSKTNEVIKAFQIDGTPGSILITIDSLSKMATDFLIISKLKKAVPPDFQSLISTNSPEAYRYFIYGNNAYLKRDYNEAVRCYSQAIDIDSNFVFATIQLSIAYFVMGAPEQAKKWCLKVYNKQDHLTMQQKIWVNRIYAQCFETPHEQILYLGQLLEFDDQSPVIYYDLGRNYNLLFQYDKAIPEFEKALEIYNKWGIKPKWSYNYVLLGISYHKTGQYKKEKKLYLKAEKDFPDDLLIINRLAILSLTNGDTASANQYIGKIVSEYKESPEFEVIKLQSLASIYSEAGILDKAEEYYRKLNLSIPENPALMNNLAYFLINNDRNVIEGLQLVNKAIEQYPDNYALLDTKGWGLYKQKEYREAAEILQKSWDLRMKYATYNHSSYLHFEEAIKAAANQNIK